MEKQSDTRVALVSMIIRDADAVETLNEILHEYRDYIIGRMGIPYHPKDMHIISIAIDAPVDAINALSGKLGRLTGVSIKVAYAEE
jgi:putative iron-only hydrogenase system regulator